MQEFARLVYAFGLAAAVIALVRSGLWIRLPLFFAALCFMALVGVSYAPESREWVTGVYMRAEPAAVLLRLAAAVEVTTLLIGPPYRSRLLIGLTLVSFAVTLSVWSLEPGSNVFAFVQFRRYVQIATAVWMGGAVIVLRASGAWGWSTYNAHAAILAVLSIKQAVYSVISFRGFSYRGWFAADAPGLIITGLCCLSWVLLALRAEPQSAPQP